MGKRHLIIVAIGFLMCAISVYYGSRIYNANENFLVTELNEFDKIYHDDVEMVPKITLQAAIVTLPLVLAMIILQVISTFKSKKRQVKNIGYGLLLAGAIILTIEVMTLMNPTSYDFSRWGFVWICMGILFIAGNLLSVAIYHFNKPNPPSDN